MPHAHTVPHRPLGVFTVTVSTSRGASEDRSGPVLVACLSAAGHTHVGHRIVPDDPARIDAVLDEALADPLVVAVVLTGGTGISARDCTPRVVRGRLDRELPGFGELFRMLSWQEVKSAAMLSTAVAGVSAGRVIFAVPGSPKACRLAMEALILPELGHLVAELEKERPLLPEGDVEERATDPRIPAPRRGGWQLGAAALGGALLPDAPGRLPPSFERVPAARDVAMAAGARGRFARSETNAWTALGFPDLVRPEARVLLLGPGTPWGEAVALHRWPEKVGFFVSGGGLLGLDVAAPLAEVGQAHTGSAPEMDGRPFAVDGKRLYLEHSGTVFLWEDGGLRAAGTVDAVIGRLLLRWADG